ncbi:MAG: phosphoribosylaminoimidazolesuccinocarboxamide synthase [Chloroflexi bacterium]|nr:phosphoribosylaminoimidazolesuccinocarboxamide synthase [Chloroflexota bacterium]
MAVILGTDFPRLFRRGKVRDTYDLGDRLLMVATDRISAFDVVLPTGIPDKGKVLTQISAFWFEQTAAIVPNHFLSLVTGEDPPLLADVDAQAWRSLRGRAMVVRRAERIDFECVVRGYLAGSAWADYRRTGAVCGIELPPGLVESQQLPEPIFTPATKEESGHDLNVSLEYMQDRIGVDLANELKAKSLALYTFAERFARSRGILLADTKMEFGLLDGAVIVIDELLTPDSSRFWPADTYAPGRSQPSFDKQYVRDWLQSTGWNKEPPAPELPRDVAEHTAEKYREAFRRLTGRPLL